MPSLESPPSEDSIDDSVPASPSTSRSQSQSSSTREKTNSEPKLQQLYDLMKSSQDLRRQKHNFKQDMDETDLFFLSMSKEVKTLSKLEQTKIKLDLHTAISQAVIRQLEHRDKILKTPITINTPRFIQSNPQHQSSTYILTTADVQSPTYNQSTTQANSPTYIQSSSLLTKSPPQNHAVSNSEDSQRFIQSTPQRQLSSYIQTPTDDQAPTYIQSPMHTHSPKYLQSSSFPSRLNTQPVVSDDLKAYYDNFDDYENDD
ncbi:unnamed protein product [Diatraea saccharalis]|uniref:BESS domain-containing protein n=1 Tax=Diatraea saccharalis TaxID=40085 RepID=A0A9N9N0B7_9NEOP|nr:unnamed protein product [Diatraea saccharalis]